MQSPPDTSEPGAERLPEIERVGAWPPPGTVVAVLAGLLAGWLAAGSTGLLGHPLRHALTWVACGAALVAVWPTPGKQWRRIATMLAGGGVAVAMTASPLPPVNVMAVALLLAVLATTRTGTDRGLLVRASAAVAALGIYRLALTSVPLIWLAADAVGGAMGRLAGRLTGRPLWVGATFAGLDFLVVMGALLVASLPRAPRPRLPRALYAACAILAAHLGYLLVLATATDLLGALPAPEKGGAWAAAARRLVPWNLPMLAAALHLAIGAAILRWTPWQIDDAKGTEPPRWVRPAGWAGLAALAILLPLLTNLPLGRAGLEGKKIVAFKEGFLNWLKPEHGDYGRLAIGMYGLLPTYVESLGAQCVVSPHLAEHDLADADVVVLLYPNEPWSEGQLERLWGFVRRGGSLLVFGEHTVRETDGGNRFNDVLEPTAMRVRFDSSMFEIGGWLHSYEALAHPATAGMGDERNQFGVVIGASVEARWPACPLLVGRWGYADPGDVGSGAAMMGNRRYDAGEKLGDQVLAAEQRLGKGRIVAFGDTSSITNGITIGAHAFTSRLLAYLASDQASPQAAWRGALGLLAAAGLLALLIARPQPWRIVAATAAIATSLALCTAASQRSARTLPDGRRKSPNNLAYLDTTHVEAISDESWRTDGNMGLAMTLIRNGYLTLDLPEFTAERLERAALLVSIAPARAFSRAERKALRHFIDEGGTFVCTVGWDAAPPSRDLLADFGFHVGGKQAASGLAAAEPKPLGHFKSPYIRTDDYAAHVRYHAAWTVQCDEPDVQVIAYGPNDTAIVLLRRIGRGKVIVVGDTGFAMNKNLERIDGRPFEGMRENADFWRWLITVLRDEPMWLPTDPRKKPAPGREGTP